MKKLRGFKFISTEQAVKDFGIKCLDEIILKLPKRATKGSAGYDVFAPFDITLQPNEEINVPTGFKAYMQNGEMLVFAPRSGLGFKFYCRLANTIGIGDKDYYNNKGNEGHYFVKIRNEGSAAMSIKAGDAMAQAIFVPFLLADDDSFETGEDRIGGFGSTTK